MKIRELVVDWLLEKHPDKISDITTYWGTQIRCNNKIYSITSYLDLIAIYPDPNHEYIVDTKDPKAFEKIEKILCLK